jgi:hypothetical protein
MTNNKIDSHLEAWAELESGAIIEALEEAECYPAELMYAVEELVRLRVSWDTIRRSLRRVALNCSVEVGEFEKEGN